MNHPLRTVSRLAFGIALLGFVIGGVAAAFEILGRRHVLDFQAGSGSPWSERLHAIVQISVIEGVGFGVVALLLGLLAVALVRLRRRGSGELAGQYLAAAFLCGAGAFFGWAWNAWVFEDALPFLSRGELALLSGVGFVSLLLKLLFATWLAARLPWAPRKNPAALALACLASMGAANWYALGLLTEGSGAYRSPARLAAVVGVVLGAILVTSLLALVLKGPVRAAGRIRDSRIWPPRWLTLSVGAVFLLCVVGTAPFFSLSAVLHDVEYRTLRERGSPEGPNVVFVVIDTLRADHLGCYGYERPTSPFIDSLAANGTRVADASAPAAWTKPATGTILTGLYPSRHGALYHGSRLQLPRGERTLAEAFRQAGYVTAGFVSNPNIKQVFDFDRGFDEFFDSPVEDTISLASIRGSYFGRILMDLLRHQFNWKYENDVRQMNEHVLAWLETNQENPFFLYVHYIDPHIPYSPPGEYQRQFARDHPGFPLFNERKELVGIDLYDGEIRYSDDGIRELVEGLEQHGLWENTLLVLTSDHGEEFFEHGILGHGFSLYQPVIHVPLVLHGPGVVPGRVVEDPVQIVDLPATVLDLAEAGADRLGDGVSFASAIREPSWTPPAQYYLENEFGQDYADQRAFVFKGVRKGRWKLVITEANQFFPPLDPRYGSLALYDLVSDPKERNNLIHEEEHRARVTEMKELLETHLTFLDETGFRDAEPAAISEDILGNLRAMGY